jgi:hypothetical protein
VPFSIPGESPQFMVALCTAVYAERTAVENLSVVRRLTGASLGIIVAMRCDQDQSLVRSEYKVSASLRTRTSLANVLLADVLYRTSRTETPRDVYLETRRPDVTPLAARQRVRDSAVHSAARFESGNDSCAPILAAACVFTCATKKKPPLSSQKPISPRMLLNLVGFPSPCSLSARVRRCRLELPISRCTGIRRSRATSVLAHKEYDLMVIRWRAPVRRALTVWERRRE